MAERDDGRIPAITAISRVTFRFFVECRYKLDRLGNTHHVNLVWVLGHSGARGNEVAGELAHR